MPFPPPDDDALDRPGRECPSPPRTTMLLTVLDEGVCLLLFYHSLGHELPRPPQLPRHPTRERRRRRDRRPGVPISKSRRSIGGSSPRADRRCSSATSRVRTFRWSRISSARRAAPNSLSATGRSRLIKRLVALVETILPPTPAKLWGARDVGLDLLQVGPEARHRRPGHRGRHRRRPARSAARA